MKFRLSIAKPRLFVLVAVLVLSAQAFAGPEKLDDPERAIEVAREALSTDWMQNWYDSEGDVVRPLEIRIPKPPTPKKADTNTRQTNGFWVWLDGWLGSINPSLDTAALLKFLFWTALLISIGYFVMQIARKYIRDERSRFANIGTLDPLASTLDRVEALPMEVDESVTDLLAEARRRQQSGDLSTAVVYLFSHQLLELDRHHLIRLVKGKTNRQYLREIMRNARQPEPLHSTVRETVALFEAAFFGGHPPRESDFANCLNQIEEFSAGLRENAREE